MTTTSHTNSIREAPGLAVKDGPFGKSLYATQAFAQGDILLREQRCQILTREWDTMDAFVAALQQQQQQQGDDTNNIAATASYLLEHSVPSVSGPVVCMSEASPFSYLNHAHTPNVAAPYRHSDIDRSDRRPSDVFEIVALRDIQAGEYLCFDYNLCAGYDTREDPAMVRFLELCAQWGVEKRPSKFV